MPKNFIILLIEIVLIFLMAWRILPLETSLFLTGLLIFYFLFSPLSDSLWLFIASIPLFVALPISETFNSMSNWRILLSVLFLVCLIKSSNYCSSDPANFCQRQKLAGQSRTPIESNRELSSFYLLDYARRIKKVLARRIKKVLARRIKMAFGSPLFILLSIFLAIGLLSLFKATSPIMGIKRLLYLINIFMLYFVIKTVAKNKESISKIFQSLGLAIGLILIIGYSQFISVFFIPLYSFWQFWAKNVIPIFYGQALSHLLSYSNTWFSYYTEAPPTLRMFSVFPDSHSFALFLILGLPFLIALTVMARGQAPKPCRGKLFLIYFLLFASLLAIILSGSRGVWLSALVPLILILILLFGKSILVKISPALVKISQIKIPRTLTASLIIFFLLFPLSSLLLSLSQKAQGVTSGEETDLILARAKTIADFSELSAKSRLEIWQMTLDSIMAQPVLGVGMGNYPVVLGEEMAAAKRGASAHNLYLDVAAEMGIFALLILLMIFWEILYRAGQVFIQSKDLFFKTFAAAFTLYFIWLLAYNLFDVVLLNDKVFLLFTVAVGLLYSIPRWRNGSARAC